MLGICAETAERGVHTLKEWVTALKLPRGRLHGMDKEGVALDMSDFGAVYIKYSSKGGQVFAPGDANLNGLPVCLFLEHASLQLCGGLRN